MEYQTRVQIVPTEIDMLEEEEDVILPSLASIDVGGGATTKHNTHRHRHRLVARVDISSMAGELTRDAKSVTNYVKKLRPTKSVTMCKVPVELNEAKGSREFTPKNISIGPYHSKKKSLFPMQSLKLQYLSDLLGRSESNQVESYMEAIEEQLGHEKDKYHEFDACKISDAEFLKMLVLDGCFIVEFLLKHAEGLTLALPGIDIDLLNNDLILIENQVPFSILQLIYQLTEYDFNDLGLKKKFSLFDLAIYYLDNRERNIGGYEQKETVDHLLHLLYMCRLSKVERIKPDDSCSSREVLAKIVYSILKLVFLLLSITSWYLLMIIFKCFSYCFVGIVYIIITGVESSFTLRNKSSSSDHYHQKSTKKSPSMETVIPTVKEINYAGMWFDTRYSSPYKMFFLPSDRSMNGGSMEINHNFFIAFENMLFYEQIYLTQSFELSTYSVYMKNLVKTELDVDVLRRYGVIKTKLTPYEGKKIPNFFSKHRPWLVLPKIEQDFLRRQFKAINEFCSGGHNKRRAKLMKEYFKSPLVIFSFVGFSILSILTVIQTSYTIYK